MLCRPATVIVGISLFAPLWAEAQKKNLDLTQLPLEELAKIEVYSASKFLQKVSNAPSSISIVTAEDIQRYGYRNFADILRSVAGFYVTYDRNYYYVGVRGFGRPGDYNSRVLIMIDGHRLNENIYDGNGIGHDFAIDIDVIDRVEFVRGPGSSLYGANAFFGVINVITKRGCDLEAAKISVEAASQSTYATRMSVGGKFKNGLDVFLAGSYFDSKGHRRLYYPEFDSPNTNNGIAQDADTNRGETLFANISFRDLSAQIAYDTSNKAIPTAAFGTFFNDRRTHTTDTQGHFDLKFQHTYRKSWDVMLRFLWDFYHYNGTYIYDYSSDELPLLVHNLDIVDGDTWGVEGQVTRSLGSNHRLTGGFEMRRSIEAIQKNFDTSPQPYSYLDSSEQPSNIGIFFQDEFSIVHNLILNAGIRHDRYSTFGGTTNPRLGLIYTPYPKMTFKLLYGHAYRAPSVYELYYRDEGTKPNPRGLKPETIRTAELVVERYLGSRFRIAGSTYYYKISSLITQQINATSMFLNFDNAGKIGAHGLELELEGKGFHGLDGKLSYALQRATDSITSAVLTNSPQHLVQFNLSAPMPWMSGRSGIEMRYMSSRNTLNGGQAGGFFLANVTLLQKKLLPNLDLSASVYNLFDKRYADPGSKEHRQDAILQNGRTFMVRLTYSFPLPAPNNSR